MTEGAALPFDTPLGPVLPAAMYLAVCAWPDSWPQRSRLVESLLHAGARAAGYRHRGPDARVLERRLNRGGERLELAFQAAEVAQLALMPAEFAIPVTVEHPERYRLGRYEPGVLKVRLPSFAAIGRGGRPAVKRLQALAANDWRPTGDPRDLALGHDDFRNRVWRRFLPALPYIITLKAYLQAQPAPVDIVTLVRNVEWLDEALRNADSWRASLSHLEAVPADFITLTRT